MLPFDLVFMDVARKESRTLTLCDERGRHFGTFLFREHYCVEPDCDCGILLVHAVWAERRQVAASFSYIFEPRPGEPQLEPEPLSPQGELSATLLGMFEQCLAKDPAYRPALLRHYAMWKRVVDDPSHPLHGKLGPHGRPAPSRRARAGRRGRA